MRCDYGDMLTLSPNQNGMPRVECKNCGKQMNTVDSICFGIATSPNNSRTNLPVITEAKFSYSSNKDREIKNQKYLANIKKSIPTREDLKKNITKTEEKIFNSKFNNSLKSYFSHIVGLKKDHLNTYSMDGVYDTLLGDNTNAVRNFSEKKVKFLYCRFDLEKNRPKDIKKVLKVILDDNNDSSDCFSNSILNITNFHGLCEVICEEKTAEKLRIRLSQRKANIIVPFNPAKYKYMYLDFINRKIAILNRTNSPYLCKLLLYPIIDEYMFNKRVIDNIFIDSEVNPETKLSIVIRKDTCNNTNINYIANKHVMVLNTNKNNKKDNKVIRKHQKFVDLRKSAKQPVSKEVFINTLENNFGFINLGGSGGDKIKNVLKTAERLDIKILCLMETWALDISDKITDDSAYGILENIEGVVVDNAYRYQKGLTLLYLKKYRIDFVCDINITLLPLGFIIQSWEHSIIFVYRPQGRNYK